MTKAVILRSSPSRHLIKHGEADSGENNNSLYLVVGMNFYSKKKMFSLKFHKHKESFYEMKKEGENSNGFNVHFNLRLFHNFPPYSLSVLKKT